MLWSLVYTGKRTPYPQVTWSTWDYHSKLTPQEAAVVEPEVQAEQDWNYHGKLAPWLGEPEVQREKAWTYHSKLTPWARTEAAAADPEVPAEKPWTYHSKLTPWTPHAAVSVEKDAQASLSTESKLSLSTATYDSKLPPLKRLEEAAAAEPEVQTERTWTYHSKLTPWAPHEAAAPEMRARTAPDSLRFIE
jgi:hypothetical protein